MAVSKYLYPFTILAIGLGSFFSYENPGYIACGFGVIFIVLLIAEFGWCELAFIGAQRLLKSAAAMPVWVFVGMCAVLFLALTATLSQVLFDGLPHVSDTHSQYVHAKIFASGHLFLPSHPLKDFFSFESMINDGKYYSGYFPGNVFLLAIGHLFGAPWLVNPIMGALTVVAVFYLTREVAGKNAGYIAAILMLLSPTVVFMSSEYMGHVATLFFLTVFLFAYIRQHKTGDYRFAVLAGCALGCGFLTRVQATVPFALPIAIHALVYSCRAPRRYLSRGICIAACFAPFLIFLGYYDYVLTGDYFLTPYQKFEPGYANFFRQFFSWQRWLNSTPDIQRALTQITEIHTELFGWPTSSLLFVLLLFLFHRQPRYGFLLLSPCLSLFVALVCLYPDNGSTVFLNRFTYEITTCLIALTAIGLAEMPYIITHHFRMPLAKHITPAAVAIMIAILTEAAFPTKIIGHYNMYKNNYWQGNAGYYDMIQARVTPPALVFVKTYEQYRLFYFTQPPLDSNPIIFALSRGPENQKLIDYYPGRTAYFFDGGRLDKIK